MKQWTWSLGFKYNLHIIKFISLIVLGNNFIHTIPQIYTKNYSHYLIVFCIIKLKKHNFLIWIEKIRKKS